MACTEELRRRYHEDDDDWVIEEGSVLDEVYMQQHKERGFDVVCSWGVLHHTGRLWDAMRAVVPCVRPDGKLFIALYADQRLVSRYWTLMKWAYNKVPIFRPISAPSSFTAPTYSRGLRTGS